MFSFHSLNPLDLGEFINRQSREETDKSRQLAVEKAVADTWDAAHSIKTQAVKEAIEKTQAQHEKQIRRLARQHDRAVKVKYCHKSCVFSLKFQNSRISLT